jgi:hypothetical protein
MFSLGILASFARSTASLKVGFESTSAPFFAATDINLLIFENILLFLASVTSFFLFILS